MLLIPEKGGFLRMIYVTKPCEIEAIEWTGNNISEICKFTNRDIRHLLVSGQLYIETLEGTMKADIGDYIIKGLRGEYYPCKPDVFHKKYQLKK